MKVTTTYKEDRSRIDSIELSAEEWAAINEAVEIIKSRCIAAGYPKDYKDWRTEEWRLIGIMKNEGGCEAALKLAQARAENTAKEIFEHISAVFRDTVCLSKDGEEAKECIKQGISFEAHKYGVEVIE